jgi:general secretion pathway protein D
MHKAINKYLSSILILIILYSSLGLTLAIAQDANIDNDKSISMDFDQVDIRVFIKFISELTGKNFVVDNRVKGRVTVISPKGISIAEAYKVFESVLEVNGFATVPSGEVTKIVSSVEARRKSVETNIDLKKYLHFDDSFVTQVVRLDNADVTNIKKVIIPMVSKTGLVVDYTPTQTLIITDNRSNLQRLVRIIRRLDVPAEEAQISVIELSNAEAENLAQNLSKLFTVMQKQDANKNPQSPFVLIPETRLNLLIVLANQELTKKMQSLVKKLDRPAPENLGNIRVIKLDNAVAEDLAKVLSELVGAKTGDNQKSQKEIISKNARIVADKATNSLVVTASPKEHNILKNIIKELDQRRRQVFIEAAILEVSSDNTFDFGITWQGGSDFGAGSSEGVAFGAVSGAIGTSAQDLTETIGQTSSGVSVGMLSFPFTFDVDGDGEKEDFFSLETFLQASKTQNQVNIISTPQIMTLENEEASVVVAQNRPFITSQQTTDADLDFTNFEYKDVGVTLKVTPQINELGSVKLNLYQEVSRVDDTLISQGVVSATTPVTKKRTAETRVEVSDGQTFVIAGLIENQDSQSTSGVPYLMDLPVLGQLFKTKDNSETKKNLMIFITPYVVSNVEQAKNIYFEKSEHIQNLRYGLDGKAQPLAKDFLLSPPLD